MKLGYNGCLRTLSPLYGTVLFMTIGALTGYITNIIAVKLLFHPEKPISVGRLKIQGVVPARKKEIITRVTTVISTYVTHDDIKELLSRAMDEELFKNMIKRRILEILESIKPLKLLKSLKEDLLEEIADTLSDKLLEHIKPFIINASKEMIDGIAENIDSSILIERKTNMLSSKDVEALFRKIAGKELRFIEYSGLFLGGLIGLIQGVVYFYILG